MGPRRTSILRSIDFAEDAETGLLLVAEPKQVRPSGGPPLAPDFRSTNPLNLKMLNWP